MDHYRSEWELAASHHMVLLDLYAGFQSAAGGHGLCAVLIPSLMIAAAHHGWTDHDPELLLLGAVAMFVGLASNSLYALGRFFWVRRKLRAVRRRMDFLAARMKSAGQGGRRDAPPYQGCLG